MAVCKIAKLKVQKNSTVYSFNMMDYGDVISAGFNQMLCVQYNGKTWYVPAYPTYSVLNYRKNGVNYGCLDISPEITVSYTKSSSSVVTSTGTITTYYIKLTSASLNIAVNTSFDIFFSSNDGASYVKAGTLSEGGLSVSLDTELSSTNSTAFRIQIRTSIGFATRTGSVTWKEYAVGYPTARIEAEVRINDYFSAGYIFYRGEYNSVLPPWHSYGDSTVFGVDRIEGRAERDFGCANLGAVEWHTILFYESNTEGAGTTKLCERGYAAVGWEALVAVAPNSGSPLVFSDGFSFEAVAGNPQTLATHTPSLDIPSGVGFFAYTLPSIWW